ncbi:GNAT family N-acetyltransferase [Streptomyces sp. NPDC094032]|uniref:GNAT family N-acetyltransferase n=1 Tax=Streptomyces sp. NPDC094032 TaxID=3155308 RepID=UPI003319BD62
MIKHPAHQPPSAARAFPTGAPGTSTLAEHVLTTGHGHWWSDRTEHPRIVGVSCAGHTLLAGDPTAVTPAELTPLAGHYVEAPDRFLPALGAAFERLDPWERMLYVHRVPVEGPHPPWGVTVRRLTADDSPALAALDPTMAWIHASWGGPIGLAGSGHGWAAFRRDRILAVACTRFAGGAYEDVACVTAPEERRRRLALACVTGLTADIAARGRTASWCCSRDNRPSRLLAWTAGFRLAREYTHYATGRVSPASRLPYAA